MLRRLVLIDGLPGSGKSTLATDLAVALNAPALLETAAGHPLHPVPPDEMGAAWADIHTRITAERFAAENLECWASFMASLGPDYGVIVESFPFQSVVRVLLQMEAPSSTIQDYWRAWTELVAPYTPLLIYLKTEDSSKLLRDIAEHRGPVWTQYLLEAFAQMPYAANRGLVGWDAATVLMARYAELIDELIAYDWIPATILAARPADYLERFESAFRAVAVWPDQESSKGRLLAKWRRSHQAS